jgi:hypothetical protein
MRLLLLESQLRNLIHSFPIPHVLKPYNYTLNSALIAPSPPLPPSSTSPKEQRDSAACQPRVCSLTQVWNAPPDPSPKTKPSGKHANTCPSCQRAFILSPVRSAPFFDLQVRAPIKRWAVRCRGIATFSLDVSSTVLRCCGHSPFLLLHHSSYYALFSFSSLQVRWSRFFCVSVESSFC